MRRVVIGKKKNDVSNEFKLIICKNIVNGAFGVWISC